jgi:hypothetical protein
LQINYLTTAPQYFKQKMKNPKKLKIKSLKKHSWADKDTVILHACFQLLTDFVDKENIDLHPYQWTHDENVRTIRVEIDALYKWWKSYVPKYKKGKISYIKGNEQYKSENEMLIRLIKIREYLWN